MKKITIMAMFVIAASVLSPVMPTAHAAIADDLLAAVIAQNPASADKVQEVLTLTQELEQGGREVLISRVAQAALDRAGQGELAGVLNEAVSGGGDVRASVTTAVRQEVENRVVEKLGINQSGLNILDQLLGNAGLNPEAVQDANSLTTDNYRQLIETAVNAYLAKL